MKLFIVAALVSVATAARLEHLQRGYLPPDHSHSQAGFGSQSHGSNGFGSQSPFESNVIDSAGAGSSSQGFGSASGFPATSNQYLPPNHGPSSNGQFSGSLTGLQRSQYTPQSFGGASQYNPNQYGSASSGNGQSRYQQYSNGDSQYQATNRQYLAPKSSFQNIPQQAFNEQTGYQY